MDVFGDEDEDFMKIIFFNEHNFFFNENIFFYEYL